MTNGWRIVTSDVINAFGHDNMAFWGLERFYYEVGQALISRSLIQQPATEYRITIGQLELWALSSVDQVPIDWDKMIWFVGFLEKLVRCGWCGLEYDAWIHDLTTGVAVRIGLRALLDAPLRRIGA